MAEILIGIAIGGIIGALASGNDEKIKTEIEN